MLRTTSTIRLGHATTETLKLVGSRRLMRTAGQGSTLFATIRLEPPALRVSSSQVHQMKQRLTFLHCRSRGRCFFLLPPAAPRKLFLGLSERGLTHHRPAGPERPLAEPDARVGRVGQMAPQRRDRGWPPVPPPSPGAAQLRQYCSHAYPLRRHEERLPHPVVPVFLFHGLNDYLVSPPIVRQLSESGRNGALPWHPPGVRI